MNLLGDSQLKLRLPSDLKQKIEAEAHEAKRSINSEVVARLENSFNFAQIDTTSNNDQSTVSPYLLFDRKKEVSQRLIQAIEWVNSVPLQKLKYSHIAELCGYDTAEIFLDWVQGKIEPTFSELKTVAEVIGVNEQWLIHGDGKPTPHQSFEVRGNPDIDIPELFLKKNMNDNILLNDIDKIYFVRSLSKHGELLIIRILKNKHIEVLQTRAHISTEIGEGGRLVLQNFARLWKGLYNSQLNSQIRSYLLKEDKFDLIREFNVHPLSIIKNMSESFWWEEIWKKEHNPHIRDTYIKNWQDWDTTARVAREAFKDEE